MFSFHPIRATFKSMRSNKMRSFLTMLGIIIGISAVIIIISIGSGAQSLIINQIKGAGSNLIGVLPGGSEEDEPPAAVFGIVITTLTDNDIKALKNKKNVEHIVDANSYVRGVATAHWQNKKVDTNFVGTNYSYPLVEDTEVKAGRFFSEDDEKSKAKVAVLGHQVWENLFQGEVLESSKEDDYRGDNPVGETIKFKKETFRVIGVMEPRGITAFQNPDNQIFIPLTTAQQFLLGIKHISMARVKVDDEKNIDQTIEEIKATLRERHNIKNPVNDDFTVRSAEQGIEALTNVTDYIKYFLAAISALALVVGGISIMNIMLITVNERTFEIGLRKAVGATNKNVILQFLTESVVVTMFGGIIGIIFGFLVSYIAAKVMVYLGYKWDFVVTINSIIVAVGVAAGIGLLFGIYPAYKASKMNPIEALRYE
jgi:putative ABC transport system permease protein